MTKSSMTSKCTFVANHFEGLADALEQYRWHCLMQHFQGYPGSHWMPPSANYSLHIAPAATTATGKQTTIKKYTYFAGHFDGRGRWRRSRVSLEVTGCCHRVSIADNSIKRTWLRQFFSLCIIISTLKKVVAGVEGPCF
jgi:hypothetical protein